MDLFVIRLATNLQYARLDPWTTCADLGRAGLNVSCALEREDCGPVARIETLPHTTIAIIKQRLWNSSGSSQ